MWIILKTILPIANPPPQLSMFFSTPFPPEGLMQNSWESALAKYIVEEMDHGWKAAESLAAQAVRIDLRGGEVKPGQRKGKDLEEVLDVLDSVELLPERTSRSRGGFTPNWSRARKINFNGDEIRVFPHEFAVLTAERILDYIQSGGFELVPGDAASDWFLKRKLDHDQALIMDAALVDGCTPEQAMMVALEMDFTLEDPDFPPAIGWYRPRQELLDLLPDPRQIGVLTEVNHARRAAAKRRKMELPQ